MRRWFNYLLVFAYLTFVSALLLIAFGLQGVEFISRNSAFEELAEITVTVVFYSPLAGFVAGVAACAIAKKAGESRGAALFALALNGALIAGGVLFAMAMPNR